MSVLGLQARAVLALPLLLAALLITACAGAEEAGIDDLKTSAVDVCSQVGVTADLAACEARLNEAQAGCATVPAPERPRCIAELDELRLAATEAYHQARGECAALTSEAARSMCSTSAVSHPASATPPPTPAASATPAATSNTIATDPPAPVNPPPEPSAPNESEGQDAQEHDDSGNDGGSDRDEKDEVKEQDKKEKKDQDKKDR